MVVEGGDKKVEPSIFGILTYRKIERALSFEKNLKGTYPTYYLVMLVIVTYRSFSIAILKWSGFKFDIHSLVNAIKLVLTGSISRFLSAAVG